MVAEIAQRFAFGRNWKRFVRRHFNEERLAAARGRLLGFLGRDDLKGQRFIDVGCGSGLHSLSAWQAGADQVVSFDYDPEAVEATRLLWQRFGAPANWTIRQGSILDRDLVRGLGRFDVVYAWGVLHHTGDQWSALDQAAALMADDALFYTALYTAEAFIVPTPDDWLATKQRYIKASSFGRLRMEANYYWTAILGGKLANLPALIQKFGVLDRGMALHTDVRDWLGGWPMEFSAAGEVLRWSTERAGLSLLRLHTGEANNEYLFGRGAATAGATPLNQILTMVDTLDQVPRDQPLTVYGAGEAGQLFLELARRDPAIRIVGFADSRKGGDVQGMPCVSPLALERFVGTEQPVALAATQYGDIAMALSRRGFRRLYGVYPLVAAELRRRRRGSPPAA